MIYGYLLIHESSTKVFKRVDLSYACCLHSRANEELLSTLNNKANPRQNYDLHPTISRTNRQVHEEALRALYGENYFTWTTDQLDALRYWNGMRNRWNDTNMHRFDRLLEPIKNPAILFGYTNRLDKDIPPHYLRLITHLHLRFVLGSVYGIKWRLLLSAMEMTIGQTVQVLRYNKLKHLLIVRRLRLNRRAWYEEEELGLLQLQN
jgi:hypothetical protein